jgi:hypothetical protein
MVLTGRALQVALGTEEQRMNIGRTMTDIWHKEAMNQQCEAFFATSMHKMPHHSRGTDCKLALMQIPHTNMMMRMPRLAIICLLQQDYAVQGWSPELTRRCWSLEDKYMKRAAGALDHVYWDLLYHSLQWFSKQAMYLKHLYRWCHVERFRRIEQWIEWAFQEELVGPPRSASSAWDDGYLAS